MAESYIESYPELTSDVDFVVDLLYTEFLEREQQGESPDVQTYAERFSEAAEGLKQQMKFHRALGEIASELTISDFGSPRTSADDSFDDFFVNPVIDRPRHFKPEIPGFELLEEIGRGGVGVVYKALDRELQRIVAIKILISGSFAKPAHLRRFKSEARAAAKLRHPNVVQIYEIGDFRGTPYLVLEFVDGGSLSDFLQGRPLPARLAAQTIAEITKAVAYIHQSGIVHRDLKPANILLSSDILDRPLSNSDLMNQVAKGDEASVPDLVQSASVPSAEFRQVQKLASSDKLARLSPKVTDFGFARFAPDALEESGESSSGATCSGDVFGTPCYMSPEQAQGRGKDVLSASDIYSLGTILYEMLTGRPPLVGATVIETVQLVIQREPIRPSRLLRSIPTDLETVCMKCLEKDPLRRYKSAVELNQDLSCFLTDRPIKARPVSATSRFYRWQRRNQLVAGLGAAIVLLTVVTIAISTLSMFQVKQQLANTKAARANETEARLDAIERLWDSYLIEAEMRRTSRRVGQRFTGIEALHRAQALFGKIEITEKRKRDLLDKAIGCLALPDMQLLGRWEQPTAMLSSFDTDKKMSRYLLQTPTGDVELRQIGDGKLLARIIDQPIDSTVSLSPNGNWIGVKNHQFSVYPVQQDSEPNLEPFFQVPAEGGWMFLNDNQHVVGTTTDGNLVVYDLTDIRKIHPIRSMGKLFSTNPIALSSDDRYAASVVDSEIRVVDLLDGSVLLELAAPSQFNEFNNIAWSPDGNQLIAGPYDGLIRVWNIADSTIAGSYRHTGPLEVRIDSEGETLMGFNPWNGTLNIWNLALEQPMLNSTNNYFLAVQRLENGGFKILMAGDDDLLELQEILVGRVVRNARSSISSVGLPTGIQFSRDGKMLLVSGTDSTCILNASNLKLTEKFPKGARFSAFGDQDDVYTLTERGLEVTSRTTTPNSESAGITPNTKLAESILLLNIESAANIAISRNGNMVAIAEDESATIWQKNNPSTPVKPGPHSDVRSLNFSPDGKWLATGSWKGTAKIWSTSDGELVKTLPTGPLCMVEFSPDGRYFATTSDGGRIWRTDDWSLHKSLGSRDSILTGMVIRFSPDSKSVVVSDSNGQFRFLDIEDGRQIMTLTDPFNERVSDFALSPDGNKLAACILDPLPRVVLWDLELLRDGLKKDGLY